MKKIQILILIAFCTFNIWAQTAKVSDEEYKIYTLILPKDKQEFVFTDKTGVDNDSKNTEKSYLQDLLKELSDETFEDFKAKNEEPAQLEKKFTTLDSYSLITLDELKENFAYKYDGEMEWEKFYLAYPKTKAIFTFSRAGFSKDGNQALVFVTFWCRYVCGEGKFYLLKKENGEWKVVSEIMRWIS